MCFASDPRGAIARDHPLTPAFYFGRDGPADRPPQGEKGSGIRRDRSIRQNRRAAGRARSAEIRLGKNPESGKLPPVARGAHNPLRTAKTRDGCESPVQPSSTWPDRGSSIIARRNWSANSEGFTRDEPILPPLDPGCPRRTDAGHRLDHAGRLHDGHPGVRRPRLADAGRRGVAGQRHRLQHQHAVRHGERLRQLHVAVLRRHELRRLQLQHRQPHVVQLRQYPAGLLHRHLVHRRARS